MENEQVRIDSAHLRRLLDAGVSQKTHPLFPHEYRALLDVYDELAALRARIAEAPVGECTGAGRMELDGESVCGFFISATTEEMRRNPFGQRVALLRLPAGSPGEDA